MSWRKIFGDDGGAFQASVRRNSPSPDDGLARLGRAVAPKPTIIRQGSHQRNRRTWESADP
jgi:hypothetical protein